MRLSLAVLLVVHGLLHLIGVAKAFRLADLPQLAPLSRGAGVVWLLATVLLLLSAAALYVWPRWWWGLALGAVIVSSVAILPAWADARAGAIVNVLVLVAALFGYAVDGPSSLRAAFEREVAAGLARARTAPVLTADDIEPLPAPVRRYLQRAGAVGQPRVQNMRLRMRGRIRNGAADPWMPITAEQYSFFDEPARLFYLTASRMFVPIQGLHRYVGPDASMQVKAAGLVSVVTESGPDMTAAETVTMFNDMCVFAPATLIDPAIRWERVEGLFVDAAFSNAGHTVRARLEFSDEGDLVNFWSDDRRQVSAAGDARRRVRWSTPIAGPYRIFGAARLAARGEARWHEAAGDYAYIELDFTDVQYNVAR